MKITGTSKDFRRSLTASSPELPSASWMSARTGAGRVRAPAVHRAAAELQEGVAGGGPPAAAGGRDVRGDEAGPLRAAELQRLRARARDADDVVAEALDQRLEIHRDQRLVLDDQNIGRHVGGKLASGLVDQLAHGLGVDGEDRPDLLL